MCLTCFIHFSRVTFPLPDLLFISASVCISCSDWQTATSIPVFTDQPINRYDTLVSVLAFTDQLIQRYGDQYPSFYWPLINRYGTLACRSFYRTADKKIQLNRRVPAFTDQLARWYGNATSTYASDQLTKRYSALVSANFYWPADKMVRYTWVS
jgi:hypothetical protein